MSLSIMPSRRLLLLPMLLLISPLLCHAQAVTTQTSLQGKVLDPNRAAVAGAGIVVEALGRGASFSALTDENGEFSLALEPGEYTLRIAAEGFAEASQTVELGLLDSAPLEIVLQVVGSTADVTV